METFNTYLSNPYAAIILAISTSIVAIVVACIKSNSAKEINSDKIVFDNKKIKINKLEQKKKRLDDVLNELVPIILPSKDEWDNMNKINQINKMVDLSNKLIHLFHNSEPYLMPVRREPLAKSNKALQDNINSIERYRANPNFYQMNQKEIDRILEENKGYLTEYKQLLKEIINKEITIIEDEISKISGLNYVQEGDVTFKKNSKKEKTQIKVDIQEE